MNVPDVDTDDLGDNERDFLVEAAMAEGLSVGANDAGELVVTCRNHDGEAAVSMTQVFALAERNDLDVVDGVALWDDEEVELVVASEGWKAGDGE